MSTSSKGLNKQRGQVLAEYLIGAIFLMLLVWYAIMGGSSKSSGEGGPWEKDVVDVTGNQIDRMGLDDPPAPGLVQAIQKKQNDFASKMRQP